MSAPAEFLFAASLSLADQIARKWGWRPCARAAWLKSDGTTVLFICLEEQLAAVPAGANVHGVSRRKRAA